jgi:uncharacterized protein (TIGR02001 family)
MKTYLTLSAIALAAAATLSSGAVMAADPAPAATPDIAVTGNFGITSDYRFRGISQNNREPSFQGGFDVAFKEGFYLGTWGSNVNSWTAGNGSLELDLYGGYKTEIAGVAVDLGAIDYLYPGSGSYKANTQEAYIGLSYGPAVLKVSRTIGDNYFATTPVTGVESAKGTMYYDLTLAQEIAPKLTASIHAGYTDKKSKGAAPQYADFSYKDYSVGLAYDYEGYVIGVKYYTNSLGNGTKSYAVGTALNNGGTLANGKSNLGASGVAVSLTKAF